MKLFVSCLILCAVSIYQSQAQDLPETIAAKAAHFEAVRRAELVIANAPSTPISSHKKPVEYTSQHKLGINVHDTPEVAAAKAAHYAAAREAEHATAVANATGRVPESKPFGGSHYQEPIHYPTYVHHPAPVHHHPAPAHYHPEPVHYHPETVHYHPEPVHHHPIPVYHPVSDHHHHTVPFMQTAQHQLGVNVHDTPEVAAAKTAHFEAVRRAEQAAAVSGPQDDGSYVVSKYEQPAPIIPAAPVVHGSTHLLDTPEVAAAKAAHFEALRRVQMAAGPRYVEPIGYVPQVMYMPMPVPTYQPVNIDYNRMGPVVAVPQTNQHKLGLNVHDTPEVAAAKAAHFEAFRQAQMVAAENERKYMADLPQHNSYFANPTRNYGQVDY